MAGTLLKITYGVDDKESISYYMQLFEEALAPIIRSAIPGSFLVDIFPALKYVPEWFPGAGFKRMAREGRILSARFADEPLNDAVKRMVGVRLSIVAKPCAHDPLLELGEGGSIFHLRSSWLDGIPWSS